VWAQALQNRASSHPKLWYHVKFKLDSNIYDLLASLSTQLILQSQYTENWIDKSSIIIKITMRHMDLPWGNPIREKTPAKDLSSYWLMSKQVQALNGVLQYKYQRERTARDFYTCAKHRSGESRRSEPRLTHQALENFTDQNVGANLASNTTDLGWPKFSAALGWFLLVVRSLQ